MYNFAIIPVQCIILSKFYSQVQNKGPKPVTGVVRIFMAPARDDTRNKMAFNKLRRYMIELDKFTQVCKLSQDL